VDKQDLTPPETIRKLLEYNPATGKLFWRERSTEFFNDGKRSAETACRCWNARHAGKEAFTADHGDGYRHGRILDRVYFAHRVIWALTHGEWPVDQIDHINGVKDDNRIKNLRAVTHQENSKNQKLRDTNTSGHVGVCWYEQTRKWQARIRVNGRCVHLGYFVRKDDAIDARKAAEVEYDYHPNHGRV